MRRGLVSYLDSKYFNGAWSVKMIMGDPMISLQLMYFFNPFFWHVFNNFRSIFMANYGIFTHFVFCRC